MVIILNKYVSPGWNDYDHYESERYAFTENIKSFGFESLDYTRGFDFKQSLFTNNNNEAILVQKNKVIYVDIIQGITESYQYKDLKAFIRTLTVMKLINE